MCFDKCIHYYRTNIILLHFDCTSISHHWAASKLSSGAFFVFPAKTPLPKMAVCGQLQNSVLRAPPVLLFSLHFIHVTPEGATMYLHDHTFLIQDGHLIQAMPLCLCSKLLDHLVTVFPVFVSLSLVLIVK